MTALFAWHAGCIDTRSGPPKSRPHAKKEIAMTLSSIPRSFVSALFALLVSTSGCGFSLDPGHIDRDAVEPHLCFEGAEAKLLRYSTDCERPSATALNAEVGDGMEFEASAVETLESPCTEAPSPAVAIEIQDNALVFDFSKVERAGRFPDAHFDGYVIDIGLRPGNALLLEASVSPESTIPLARDDIYHEPDHIEVNFAGLSYDENGLVKIDLWFANVDPQLSGES
jgi:hypothetical protein